MVTVVTDQQLQTLEADHEEREVDQEVAEAVEEWGEQLTCDTGRRADGQGRQLLLAVLLEQGEQVAQGQLAERLARAVAQVAQGQ